jgi:hypothetical protein
VSDPTPTPEAARVPDGGAAQQLALREALAALYTMRGFLLCLPKIEGDVATMCDIIEGAIDAARGAA